MLIGLLIACVHPPEPVAAPVALVYRGPAGCEGCSEAVGHLLHTADPAFSVTYVGPDDEPLTDDLLATATIYAQPGGNGTVEEAFVYVADDADRIRAFVSGGGRYLGFCMGGYFAGFNPGFEMLPGDSDEYITSPGADVTDENDTVVAVRWGDVDRDLYFQDGPYFIVDDATDVDVLATYKSNGEIAAMVAPYGAGRVGVVGPHPEARAGWYDSYGLVDPDGLDRDYGHALVTAVLR